MHTTRQSIKDVVGVAKGLVELLGTLFALLMVMFGVTKGVVVGLVTGRVYTRRHCCCMGVIVVGVPNSLLVLLWACT